MPNTAGIGRSVGIQSIDRAARILNALAVEQDRNSGKYQPGAAACCNSYLDLNDCALARWCTPSGLPSVAMPPWASV
jgi:hypothetical protein